MEKFSSKDSKKCEYISVKTENNWLSDVSAQAKTTDFDA